MTFYLDKHLQPHKETLWPNLVFILMERLQLLFDLERSVITFLMVKLYYDLTPKSDTVCSFLHTFYDI
jgi:hypothetical protein